MTSVKVDAKGRIAIPKKERESLGIAPGDTVFLSSEGSVLRIAKAENPFDGLAAHALGEYKAGRTRSLRSRDRSNS